MKVPLLKVEDRLALGVRHRNRRAHQGHAHAEGSAGRLLRLSSRLRRDGALLLLGGRHKRDHRNDGGKSGEPERLSSWYSHIALSVLSRARLQSTTLEAKSVRGVAGGLAGWLPVAGG